MTDTYYASAAGQYLLPSPAGAFKAISESGSSRLRDFLLALLEQQGNAEISEDNLRRWSGLSSVTEAHEFVWRVQSLGWIQAIREPYRLPSESFQETLPKLLPPLSREGKILLADTQGFYLYSKGFPHETAEELSALSADLASMHARRAGALNHNLGLSGSAWALTDAAGHAQLGFWPVFVGTERFVLVIAGAPAFNQPQLVEFAFVLHKRFSR